MKKIVSGIVIILWLCFLQLRNVGFANPNFVWPPSPNNNTTEECRNGQVYQNPLDCPAKPKTPQENCESDWWIRKNWACVNDYAADQKAAAKTKKEECKKSCKWDTKFCDCKCNWWIVLNTDFPFIGRCISKWWNTADGNSSISAIAQAFTNIFMTLIITWGFAMVIRWWVQIAMGQNKDGMKKIQNVVIAFAALGSLGIILRLINPNFFK